ncbi:MAG: ankyrin repeat domain-containing protein [Mailhella sp.]|nr:ankyrin repeat domain-containing protein [Mailhella sp.]
MKKLLFAAGLAALLAAGTARADIFDAAQSGDVDAVTKFLFQGTDVNTKANGGWTPLHWAARYGKAGVVRVLLASGADAMAKDRNERTPLHWAAENNSLDVAKALLESGANVNAKDHDGRTPLHTAAHYGSVDMIKTLMEAGADFKLKDEIGWTPLHSAAQAGNSDAVLMLLAAGADMNLKDNKGKTPLELVSTRDKAGMEQSLHVLPQDDKRLMRIVQDAWMPAFPREEGYLNTGEAFTMFFGKSGKWQVMEKKKDAASVRFTGTFSKEGLKQQFRIFFALGVRDNGSPYCEPAAASINGGMLTSTGLRDMLYAIFLESQK